MIWLLGSLNSTQNFLLLDNQMDTFSLKFMNKYDSAVLKTQATFPCSSAQLSHKLGFPVEDLSLLDRYYIWRNMENIDKYKTKLLLPLLRLWYILFFFFLLSTIVPESGFISLSHIFVFRFGCLLWKILCHFHLLLLIYLPYTTQVPVKHILYLYQWQKVKSHGHGLHRFQTQIRVGCCHRINSL